MAVIDIGTIVVDMSISTYNPFSLVSVQPGNAYVFSVAAVPAPAELEYGYFIVTPFIRVNGTDLAIGSGQKWFPRGQRQSIVVPVYSGLPATTQATLAVVPIEIFRGRASPPSFTINANYEDSLLQPLGFGV